MNIQVRLLLLSILILFSGSVSYAQSEICVSGAHIGATRGQCMGRGAFECYNNFPDTGDPQVNALYAKCLQASDTRCEIECPGNGPELAGDSLPPALGGGGTETRAGGSGDKAAVPPAVAGASPSPAVNLEAQRTSETSLSTCESAKGGVGNTCNVVAASNQLTPALAMFSQQRNSNDMLGACKTAAKIQMIGSGINLAFGFECGRKATSCVNACTRALNDAQNANDPSATERIRTARQNREYCQEKGQVANGTVMQGMQFAASFAQSKLCDEVATNFPCMDTVKAVDNPVCAQEYCSKDPEGRKNEPACQKLYGDCSNPQVAAASPRCVCERDPNNALCPRSYPTTNANNNANGSSGSFSSSPGIGRGSDPSGDAILNGIVDSKIPELEYTGSSSKSSKSVTSYEDSKGGGVGMAGGAGGGFGNGANNRGRPGAGGSGYKTDIMSGTSGGAGGGGYPFGRGSGDPAYGKAGGKIDYAAYMPGGAKDPKRLPAGVSQKMFDAGITAANGLSNFEKVTRKMNEKRPWLLPGE